MKDALLSLVLLTLVLGPPLLVAVEGGVRADPDGDGARVAGEEGPGEIGLEGSAGPEPAESAEASPVEAQEVLDVVQRLFDAIGDADPDVVRRVVLPDAHIVSVDATEEGVEMTTRTGEEFAESLVGVQAHFLERMWSAEVRIDGPMAMVWTPYDFHVDREFSHCGVDVFDLVRTGGGWRIVSVTYTRYPPGRCGESPLGAVPPP